MKIRDPAEVGARLEETVLALLGEHATDAEKYETYERVAIQILDSEFMDYPTGELEAYLLEFLARLPCKPE